MMGSGDNRLRQNNRLESSDRLSIYGFRRDTSLKEYRIIYRVVVVIAFCQWEVVSYVF